MALLSQTQTERGKGYEVEENRGSFFPELLHDEENEEAIDPDEDNDETGARMCQ